MNQWYFSTFTVLCDHHFYPVSNHFPHPQSEPCTYSAITPPPCAPLSSHSSSLLPPDPGNYQLAFSLPRDLPILDLKLSLYFNILFIYCFYFFPVIHRSLCVSLNHRQCLLHWKNSEAAVLRANQYVSLLKGGQLRIEPSCVEPM